MQYMAQSFRIRDPEIKDPFLDIAAEELGHMEMVTQTINLLNGHYVGTEKTVTSQNKTASPTFISRGGFSVEDISENNFYGCPFSRFAVKRYLTAVILHGMLYNRKPETCTARFL